MNRVRFQFTPKREKTRTNWTLKHYNLNNKTAPNIDDDIIEPTPSTFSNRREVLSDVCSGLELLENVLLGHHPSGLVASPFSDSVKNDISKLQHLDTLHGTVSHCLSGDEC
jgi:hypothetical protein